MDVIVALTTWKGRIYNKDFCKVLFRLCKQQITKFNYKVVLSLSEEEFPNKENDLPNDVLLFNELDNFEILWSYKNTRALKNYFPVKRKYRDLPIIVIGDDTIYSEKLVEDVMTEHLKNPTCALGNLMFYWDDKHDNIPVLYQVRLFPPKCMFNLSEDYFINYFKNLENDIFYGICLKLNHTNCKAMNIPYLCEKKEFFGQEKKLNIEYKRPENDPKKFYEQFIKEHPELLEIIKQN
jgi:hypothetical protein